MKFKFSWLVATGLVFVTTPSVLSGQPAPTSAAQEVPQTDSCGPVNGLHFVCGLMKPEDLVLVPETKWLVASGVAVGARLSIVDTSAKTAKPLYTGSSEQLRPDTSLYSHCPGPPDPAGFAPHGLALRPGSTPGTYRLYVVSHVALEGIQIFALDARGAEPTLTWTGCVPLPKMMGNAVTAFSDGTILTTVKGNIEADGPKLSTDKIAIGAVASWKPGEETFHQLRGTEMFGSNGIEISPDEKEFYVVSSETGTVTVFSRSDPSRPLRQSRAPLSSLDNLRWTEGHLIAAGMMFDEPACGGTRQQIVDRGHAIHDCHRGYAAVELNPATMEWRVVAYSEPNPVFDGVATAIPVGQTLWLSSFLSDRVAYRPLPGAP